MTERSVRCFVFLMLGVLLWPSLSLAAQQSKPAALSKEQDLRQTVSRALNSLGIFYYETQDSAKATEILEEALKYNPEDAGIRVNLAMVYLGQKQFEKVTAALGPDAKFGEHDQRSITAMAVSNFVLGKYDQAVFYFNKLSQLLPAEPAQTGVPMRELPAGVLQRRQRQFCRLWLPSQRIESRLQAVPQLTFKVWVESSRLTRNLIVAR